MIKRLEIIDFMAHKRTELELDRGVTVLTGPNNTGKSAVVEAVRSIAENPPAKTVIRHGAKQTLVRIELESGKIVEWERTPTRALYRIRSSATEPADASDGAEPYAKFGRTPPEDVRALVRLDPIQTETGKVDIHIGNQRYPIFLLDQSGAQAASFFAASTEAEYLLQMQQELKARTDAAKRRRKELFHQIKALEHSLTRYATLPEIAEQLQTAEDLYSDLERIRKALPALQQTLVDLQRLIFKTGIVVRSERLLRAVTVPPTLFDIGALEQSLTLLRYTHHRHTLESGRRLALEPLSPPPQPDDTADLEALRRGIAGTRQAFEVNCRRQQFLAALGPPPDLFDIGALERSLSLRRESEAYLRQLDASRRALEAATPPPQPFDAARLEDVTETIRDRAAQAALTAVRNQRLKGLKPPPQPASLSRLNELCARLKAESSTMARISVRSRTLAELEAPREALETSGLSKLIKTVRELIANREKVAAEQAGIEATLTAKRADIEALITRTGTCPLCRQPMDLDHFLEITHDR